VFTSNLGIYSTDGDGNRVANVTAEQPFEEVRRRVRAEIEKHFKLVLNRPEILNRIGENIIVFDFIRPDVAATIFAHMVCAILANAKEAGYDVALTDEATSKLRQLCLADLSNGGRGIRNQLESHLTNPLARALFDKTANASKFRVTGLTAGATTRLEVEPA
jgi:ATP-dependent Clp protease ATP-binding subunit ClpA